MGTRKMVQIELIHKRAESIADRAVCDKPPSQFIEEWLRAYEEALRELASEIPHEDK